MKPKKQKKRNTFAKEITKAAQAEEFPFKAHEIAYWGRLLSPLEVKINMYLASKAGLKTKESKRWEGPFQNGKADLIEEFMEAVDNYDSKKFHEFADSISFFKNVRRPEPDPVDWEREALLRLKILTQGQKVNIQKVAAYLAKSKNGANKLSVPYVSADGFSALRRKCKELNIPIAYSRKIRAA